MKPVKSYSLTIQQTFQTKGSNSTITQLEL